MNNESFELSQTPEMSPLSRDEDPVVIWVGQNGRCYGYVVTKVRNENSNGSIYFIRVDNQRIDYMVAYENHMVDVQKELYLLREKVQEIATDRYPIKKNSVANETYNLIRLLLSCSVSCFY